MRGCTAKLAIDAKQLVAFIDFHSEYRLLGDPKRRRATVNGVPWNSDTDARTIRRWRHKTDTVTKGAAERMLARFNLTLDEFTYWCSVRNIKPTIRGDIS
jgi:hypothetical protein